MDLSRYTFRASECASKLDEIEPKLGVKFDRKALFDREQYLVDQSRQGPRLMDVCWTFKVSKTGSGVNFFTSRGSDYEEVKECGCGNHIEFTSRELGYGTNALECALVDLDSSIPKIQALRQPKPAQEKQVTTQDKETIMHESIARASLVAFAEFIGQPINDLDATFQQARALYGNVGPIACVVKIPVDKTKPIVVTAVDGGPFFDGVALNGDVVKATYYLGGSTASVFRSCAATIPKYASEALKILTTERTKQTPPPPAKPEPIPYESECRAHVKRLNKELGINLNEDAVLAAGEAVRVDAPAPSCSYILTIMKSTRAASFSVVPGRNVDVSGFGKSALVIVREMYSNVSGLQCALLSMLERGIPEAIAQFTPPAPSKPALTVDDMRPGSVALDEALKIPGRPPIYVFGGKESERRSTDNEGFFAALTSGASNLFLTFQRKADRAQLTALPRAHVHTSPTPFLPEFNTTISAPIDPANPAATLTALAERITTENL